MEAGGRIRSLASIVAAGALLAACVPSLEPARRDRAVDRPGWPGLEVVSSDAPAALEVGRPLDRSSDRPRDQRVVVPDSPPKLPDLYVGAWHQVQAPTFCPAFCPAIGLQSAKSPEGCHCTSGENRPASAIAAGIKYPFGCAGAGCANANSPCPTFSDEMYCYHVGQKVDDDNSDLTVGCFCR